MKHIADLPTNRTRLLPFLGLAMVLGVLTQFGAYAQDPHAGHDHAAAGNDHRELRFGQQLGRLVEAVVAAGAAIEALRLRNFDIDFAVEVIARDV